MKCLQCENEFEPSKFSKKHKYCSKKCKTKAYYYKDSMKNGRTAQKLRGYQKKKDLIKELGGKCQICGYNKNFTALDFHHKNPEEKDFVISGKHNNSFEILLKEVRKCMLLCRNCHAEIHNPNCVL
jgi:hypothetical protein